MCSTDLASPVPPVVVLCTCPTYSRDLVNGHVDHVDHVDYDHRAVHMFNLLEGPGEHKLWLIMMVLILMT